MSTIAAGIRTTVRRNFHLPGLTNKVALVTGGSRGIGRAVAVELARVGAHIAINYLRNVDSANSAKRQIEELKKKCLLVQANVGNVVEVKEMFVAVEKNFGQLDILVHCASLGIFKPLTETRSLQLSRIMQINSMSFVTCVQEASRLMAEGGKIVAVSSLGSKRYVTGYGTMGMAKASLEAAVRYMAVELAQKGVSVNAVVGGPVDTEGLRVFPKFKSRAHECIMGTPMGRLGRPEDIAKVILFLCSKDSDWICGQTIVADGGISLRLLNL